MNDEIREIIIRMLSRETLAEDYSKLLEWLNASKGNSQEFGQYEALWNALEIVNHKNEFNAENAYSHFDEKVKSNLIKPQKKFFIHPIFKMAAGIVLVLSLSIFALRFIQNRTIETVKQCMIVTPKGSKTMVILSDGTKIWLNAESKLRYPDKFENEKRVVFLEGEGYFEVAKDKKRPFIVQTSKINVRAVGTTFNVKSYPSEDIIQTTLIEGAVIIEKGGNKEMVQKEVKNSQNLAILKPKQQATFFKSTNNLKVSNVVPVVSRQVLSITPTHTVTARNDSLVLTNHVNTDLFTSWKDNRLLFDNELFESLSVRLERRFSMKFIFMQDELKNYRFTGHFDEITIDQALNALQYASPFNYKIIKKNIYISLKPIHTIQNENE
jgi:transmembrane sensor